MCLASSSFKLIDARPVKNLIWSIYHSSQTFPDEKILQFLKRVQICSATELGFASSQRITLRSRVCNASTSFGNETEPFFDAI